MGTCHPQGTVRRCVYRDLTAKDCLLFRKAQIFAKYLFLINYTSNVFPSPIREGRYGRKGWGRKTQRKVGDGERGEERKDSDTGTSVGPTQPRRNA